MDPAYQAKIDRAVQILRKAGARQIYVFGSVSDEREQLPGQQPRDLDLAVEGLPRAAYLPALSELLYELRFPVDLIDLDHSTPLTRRLRERGRLRRVA